LREDWGLLLEWIPSKMTPAGERGERKKEGYRERDKSKEFLPTNCKSREKGLIKGRGGKGD